MSYYTTGSGSIMLQIPSDTARRQLYDDLLGRYDQLCSEEMSQCGEQMAKSVQGEYQRRKCQMKRYDDPLWWLTTVLNDVGFVELERGMETDDFFIEMTYSGNYDERTVMDVLDMLVPYTQEGCISYIGEDNTYWRHQFVDGVWVKLRGQICYETPEQCRCQTFPQTHANLERLIFEIRRHAIYDNRPYEKKARVLLEAYDQMDPDGVLLALTGRRLHTHEATGSSPVVSTKNHRNHLIPVILFHNPQLFMALNFRCFFKTHNLTHTGKGAESTGQGQTGNFLSGPVFFAVLTASAG